MKLKELMDAGKVTDPYIGYVGAYPYAEVVSGYTAFFLGIRSIVPTAYMDVQYTNSWFDITAEAEAANALMAKGCVIIGQHADSTGAPSAVEAAFKSGKTVYSVGYNVDMLKRRSDVALTSPQNNWGVVYTELIKTAMDGGDLQDRLLLRLRRGRRADLPAGHRLCRRHPGEAVDKAIEAIKAGTLHVFDTSTFTVAPKAASPSPTHAFATDTNGDFVADADEAIIRRLLSRVLLPVRSVLLSAHRTASPS
jgi:basic membrane protein A